jgi:transcriptional regulator with XRE-family HTH domain
MTINARHLRSKVYEAYESQADFSRKIGWNSNKINLILKGKRVPDVDECAKISGTLSLTGEEYIDIFMPSLSPNGDTCGST